MHFAFPVPSLLEWTRQLWLDCMEIVLHPFRTSLEPGAEADRHAHSSAGMILGVWVATVLAASP